MRSVVLDVLGYELNAQEKEVLSHPLVAGVILFTRNFDNQQQLKELIKQIRFHAKKEVLIAVDHEGGRVQRFKEGFTILPAAGDLLTYCDLEEATNIAYASAWVMASELIACDIDFSFAPVIDINGISDVIGTRAFACEPEHVITLATSYVNGMHDAGMASTGKHFPGHGSVKADSHVALPVDHRSASDIFNQDILPFKALIKGSKLSAVMPSHVVYSQCDDQPAGFSEYWLQQVLRNEIGFSGVVISDDLSMHGASFVGDHLSRAHSALNAGCDLILACNDSDAAISILDGLTIPDELTNPAISKMRYTGNKFSMPLKKNPIWIENNQKLMQFAERI